jgi:hypothetical protein
VRKEQLGRKLVLLGVALAAITWLCHGSSGTATNAGFRKLQALVGEWQGENFRTGLYVDQ